MTTLIKRGEEIVFKEPTPSSDRKTRVLALIMLEESSETVKRVYLDYQREMTELENYGLTLQSGHQFSVKVSER